MILLKKLLSEGIVKIGIPTGKSATLTDLYGSYGELDPREYLYQDVTPNDFDVVIPIYRISFKSIPKIKNYGGSDSLISSFKSDASPASKKIVATYVKSFSRLASDTVDETVILLGDSVVDGNHRLIAAAISKKDIYAVNLMDLP